MPIFAIQDNHPSLLLSWLFWVIHLFHMTLFFWLSGYFAHSVFHRRGLAGFAKDRGLRVLAPLVVGWVLILPAMIGVLLWGTMVAHGGVLPPRTGGHRLTSLNFFHLWFLYLLLIFCAAGLGLRGLVVAADTEGAIRASADRMIAWLVTWPGTLATALTVPSAWALINTPGWIEWFGIPTPYRPTPNLAAVVIYGAAYVLGWLMHRQPQLLAAWRRSWALNLVFAATSAALALIVIGARPTYLTAAPGAQTLIFASLYAFATWSSTVAVIGLCLRFLDKYSAVRRYIADASYWIYLVHLPLVLALQVAVARLEAPALLKFGLLLVVAFGVLFASYQTMVRHTLIGVWLNGAPRRGASAEQTVDRGPAAPEPLGLR
jgi:hypothetical protein